MSKEIRWKQRFQNYEKAFLRLKEAVVIEQPNKTEESGTIQAFEFTFDLG